MAEAKIKIVPPTPTSTPTADELAAAVALADGSRELGSEIGDFQLIGPPIDFNRKAGADANPWYKKVGGEVIELDCSHDYIVDCWSFSSMLSCWQTGADGKRKKTSTIGPVRRIDNVTLPRKDDWPDRDPECWETNKDGKRVDPWSRQHLANIKDDATNETLSWICGFEGSEAIAVVLAAYAKGVPDHPGQMPVVKLGAVRSYGYDGVARTKPALILTGTWKAFGAGQSAPPAPVTTSSPTTATLPKEVKARKPFGENEDIPF